MGHAHGDDHDNTGFNFQTRKWLGAAVYATTLTAWVVATLWILPLICFGLHRVEQRPRLLRFAGEIPARSLQAASLVFFCDALLTWSIVVIAGTLRTAPGRRRG